MKGRAGSFRTLGWPPVLSTPDGWSEGELDGHGCPSDPQLTCHSEASSLGGLFILSFFFFFSFLAGILFYFMANSNLPWVSQRRTTFVAGI